MCGWLSSPSLAAARHLILITAIEKAAASSIAHGAARQGWSCIKDTAKPGGNNAVELPMAIGGGEGGGGMRGATQWGWHQRMQKGGGNVKPTEGNTQSRHDYLVH